MECRVEFDYVAQEADELTIKKGDTIKNVVTKMDGWYEGTLNGKTGVFPDNFVKVVEKATETPDKSVVPSEVVLRNNPSSARRVKVLFSYTPEQDDELGLEVGDVLDFIGEVEEGWWRGKLKGKVGIFPSNFVQEVEEKAKTNGNVEARKSQEVIQRDNIRSNHSKVVGIPDVVPSSTPTNNQSIEEDTAPELPPKPVRELARCFYPYTAQNEDELSLFEGDIITIISKTCEDEGWWRGENRGKIGMFPDNFVKIITPGETASPAHSNGPQPKLSAQDRNIALASAPPLIKKGSISSTNGSATVVDGIGASKVEEKEKTPESKLEPTKTKLKATSPGIAAFHSNLFQNPNQKPDAFARRDPTLSTSKDKDDKEKQNQSDESEEFNSVERTEILNHLTATRAKAPKRRPPSTNRENETPMMNGSSHSFDSSMPDSPPPLHSTPNSLGFTSNGTASGSYTDHSGSFASQNRDKEGSPTPVSSANNSISSSASKPKQQAPPWISELKVKQTQDKKRTLVSPTTPAAPIGAPSGSPSVTTSAVTSSTISQQLSQQGATPTPALKDTHSTKAPPLPAKPSSLSTSVPTTGQDKAFNNLNHSSSFGPTVNKGLPKKSPSPAPPASNISNSIHNNLNNTTDSNRGDIVDSNKGFVTYEEYATLKSKVTSLETEVETLKRQIKMLMDRDLTGHIV